MSRNNRIKQEAEKIFSVIADLESPESLGEIAELIKFSINRKTLQRRVKSLVEEGLIKTIGTKRNTKYYANKDKTEVKYVSKFSDKDNNVYLKVEENNKTEQKYQNAYAPHEHPIFSKNTLALLAYLETPSYARQKSSYQFNLIERYIPNQTQYVPNKVREKLTDAGKRLDLSLAAGTYAKNISQRLLIDLSFNSSRLEGNTYSKLDTQRLIEQGNSAKGKVQTETVMIMNHKEAIEFLIENGEEIAANPFTIRNIHALLSQDLLANPSACGNIRNIEVGISKSSYMPLNNRHKLEEYFLLVLLKAEAINDPFEQSFFLLVHLSYLQAFEDVNKRTARLACNIPFIQHNLCPLSFVDVPQDDYNRSMLYFYETNQVAPALELFEWSYLRSCQQYSTVKESVGEIDSYRILHRNSRKLAMGHIIRNKLTGNLINPFLQQYCIDNNIPTAEKFISMTINDLKQLHLGAIIGLGITEKAFIEWKNLMDEII